MSLDRDLREALEDIRRNRSSGAAQLVRQAMAVLAAASVRGQAEPAAVLACRAQPSMAPIWNAAIRALGEREHPGGLALFAARLERAPAALARVCADAFPGSARHGWRVATLSSSHSVRICLDALHARGPLHVFCSESRPALEGRRLAASLAEAGAAVTCFSDAAIAHALDSVEAVILGADAIGPSRALNKVGSRMLAEAAYAAGVPVYLVASRDKFATRALWGCLSIRDAAADEVWPEAPPSVVVRNPYFEEVPLTAVTAVITDMGLIAAEMVPEVCDGQDDASLRPAFARLQALVDEAGPL